MHLQPLEVLDHVGSLIDDGKQVDMIYMAGLRLAFDKPSAACCKSFTSSDLEASFFIGLALT